MNNPNYPPNLITRNYCRVCGNRKLFPIISLGDQHIINFTDSSNEIDFVAPLDLVLCEKQGDGCGLVQLIHTVPGDLLYREFWYKSGINQSMRDALLDVVKKTEQRIELNSDDIIVDIGSNDSTLLRSYENKNLVLVGFEPAKNLYKEAIVGTSKIFNDFFNFKLFESEFGNKKAKVITSISMFYDLENPNEFVDDVTKILDKDGIFVIQMNYLKTMLEKNAFDNIVHEHLEYYSLKSLEFLLKRHNLTIFDVDLNDLNGGSFRVFIKHNLCELFPTNKRVLDLRKDEEELGLEDKEIYQEFAKKIDSIKKITCEFIQNEVKNGKSVYVYGASTRGNTLLQFFNLNEKLIKKAVDRNSAKWGKKIIGTKIEIISEEQARKEMPDYFLVLPWYFIDEFYPREERYIKNGGKMIVPLPDFRIIDSIK